MPFYADKVLQNECVPDAVGFKCDEGDTMVVDDEADPMSKRRCATTPSKYVGCYVNNAAGDLLHGPKKYGFTPKTCQAACKQYRFVALQDGGKCSCDNSYGTPSDEYGKVSNGECDIFGPANHGQVMGKGQGGKLSNAVYDTSGTSTGWYIPSLPTEDGLGGASACKKVTD